MVLSHSWLYNCTIPGTYILQGYLLTYLSFSHRRSLALPDGGMFVFYVLYFFVTFLKLNLEGEKIDKDRRKKEEGTLQTSKSGG